MTNHPYILHAGTSANQPDYDPPTRIADEHRLSHLMDGDDLVVLRARYR